MFKFPTKLRKMKLNSVDLVRRGANPEAHIALHKSFDEPGAEQVDVAKAGDDLAYFADVLGESFSSIMKDDSLTNDEKVEMVEKSMSEFSDTLGEYFSSLGILEKSEEDNPATIATQKSSKEKGDVEMMNYQNVDKSLLSPEEQTQLEALLKKASPTETKPAVNPAAAQEEEEKKLPPEVQKALEEVETLKKSYEMKELEAVAKKYEVIGKKAEDEAKVLYDLKKSGEGNYNAYIAALDAQVELVEKSGMFAEIGKSGVGSSTSVAKSEPESKIEAIAKGYMEKDPNMSHTDAVAKAWENNPELLYAYEENAGF